MSSCGRGRLHVEHNCEVISRVVVAQGGVYKLVDKDGNVDPTRVLKAKHRYALLVKVKREWEIGRCIANLYEPDSSLPGYMATGEGVVTENGNFIGAHQHAWHISTLSGDFLS